jgi:hypothetical protein
MAETGTAVPSNVNLARQKPYAVSAYSRRVKSLANNAQNFGPDSYVNITLDTSTPGSFLDPLQSYLKFDLTIENTNVLADFVSFGSAGAASLIEEFRIYVQGTPIEEILQYNVFYEMAMNQNGQCQQPYYLYKTNPMPLGVSSVFHQNAIKPPMVDQLGRPMYGQNVSTAPRTGFGYKNCAWAYASGSTMNTMKLIASQSSGTNKVCFSGCRPFFDATAEVDTTKILPYAPIGGGDNTMPTTLLTMDAHSLLLGSMSIKRDAETTLASRYAAKTTGSQVTQGLVFPGTRQDNAGAYQNTTLSASKEGVAAEWSALAQGQVGLDSYLGDYQVASNTATAGTVSVSANYVVQNKGGILPFTGTTVEVPACFGASVADVNPDFDPYNPLNWHSILPPSAIRPDLRTLGPDNLQDYFMFLANTKLVPVGTPGWDKYSASNAINGFNTTNSPPAGFKTSVNFRNFDQYYGTSHPTAITYTVCIPLISGVLGSFADKCWPTMLVAPGSMYIQIRTASAAKAFQISMDPCRRVLGTVRDYLPFGGSLGGLFGQIGRAAAPTSTDVIGNLGQQSVDFNLTGNTSDNVFGFLPRNTMSEYRAPAYFTMHNETGIPADERVNALVTSRQVIEVTESGKEINSMMNGYACIGSSLASANSRLSAEFFDDIASPGFGLSFRPYGVAALEGRWTIGRSYISQFSGTNFSNYMQITEESSRVLPSAGTGGSTLAPMFSGARSAFLSGVTAITSTVPRGPSLYQTTATQPYNQMAVAAYPNSNVDDPGAVTAFQPATVPQADVTTEFHTSGIPLPQYILSPAPWLQKNFAYGQNADRTYGFWGATTGILGSEITACYGSYLSASIPQSRRVLQSGIAQNGTTTYRMSNIEFVSQQIILPDSVSASILEDAASGDISLNSNSIHNYQTPCGVSPSQNLIIPAKIASANTMYCLFVPQAFVSGNAAALYNSLRGVNPFAAVSARNGITSNGVTSPYTLDQGVGFAAEGIEIINSPCRSGVLQVQLKIGNELLPQQPLTTITEIVTENVKAQHKLFDTQSNVNSTFSITTTERDILGSLSSRVTGLAYDSIKSGQFTTAFVPVDMLDDQTAINNPAMAYAYACEANRIATQSNTDVDISNFIIPRNPFSIPLFEPPESTFVIAFDLDTWSRYSDVTRSGKYLGNNTITLTLQSAVGLGLTNQQSGSNGYILQTFIVHDIRFSFQAGGSVVSYY